MKNLRKSKITSEKLGEVLSDFVVKTVVENLQKIGFSNVDGHRLWREMTIVHLFAVIQTVRRIINNEHRENEVFENMHRHYYRDLAERFDFSAERIAKEFDYALGRYRDYQEIIDDESDNNWIEKVTERMFRNLEELDEDEPVDPARLEQFNGVFCSLLKKIPELLAGNKIITEWE